MAEKLPTRIDPQSDDEPDAVRSKKKKRTKLAIYITAFVIFLTSVVVIAFLTVLKFNSPKVRLSALLFDSVFSDQMTTHGSTDRTTSSFGTKFQAQLIIKNNKNFGPYRFDANTVSFTHNGVTVGTTKVPAGKAGTLSTGKVPLNVTVDSGVLTGVLPEFGVFGSGLLTLTCHVKLTGEVRLVFVWKKRKSAEMNCTLSVKISDMTHDLKCM